MTTPTERRKREAERCRRKRADPAYRTAEYAKNAERERTRRAQLRALTARALRVTFSDNLPDLVAGFMRDLTARPAPTTPSNT